MQPKTESSGLSWEPRAHGGSAQGSLRGTWHLLVGAWGVGRQPSTAERPVPEAALGTKDITGTKPENMRKTPGAHRNNWLDGQ